MLKHLTTPCARLQIRKGHLRFATASQYRKLLTLAIETSCDDTSVAILDKDDKTNAVKLHYHEKVTANNLEFRGVHPLVAQHSHEQNLSHLISAALRHLPRINESVPNGEAKISACLALNNATPTPAFVQKPDFVSVTRGPGMRSSLNAGLNTAKGLAIAWQVPLVGVNHMQAHALTPRLVSCIEHDSSSGVPLECTPRFPFLSLLVSGGHSMLIRSESLCSHPTLASTADIAIGDAIDKMARDVLPVDVLESSKSTMYGPALEAFAFPAGDVDYAYNPPSSRKDEIEPRSSRWGWTISPILAESKNMQYSFTGVCSAVKRIVDVASSEREISVEERRDLAREAMRVVFEHLASRTIIALERTSRSDSGTSQDINTLVVSGGVAANGYLKHILRAILDARGYAQVKLVFPPLALCTDNAAMIGWAGLEMFGAGWKSDFSCQSLRKWSLDPQAEDGGILGATGWQRLQDK